MFALVASADVTDERVGEAYEFEERLTVIGPKLNRATLPQTSPSTTSTAKQSRVSRWLTPMAPFAS